MIGPRLSKAGKMPCRSWSLQAIETCPGARKSKGELVDACAGCYARTGFYKMDNVKAPRIHNKEDWKRKEWVSEMVEEIDSNDRYFRWFDSGDIYHTKLADKIYAVCSATPHCQHWIPTRSHKYPKFHKVLEALDSLPNVKVRYSSDSIVGEYTPGLHGSTIMSDGHKNSNITKCYAYRRDRHGKVWEREEFYKLSKEEKRVLKFGSCGSCRLCWNKDIDVIGYVQHGRKMRSVMLNKVKGE